MILEIPQIVVDSMYIRDHKYYSRKIEKIPVTNNTIPKNNNVLFLDIYVYNINNIKYFVTILIYYKYSLSLTNDDDVLFHYC